MARNDKRLLKIPIKTCSLEESRQAYGNVGMHTVSGTMCNFVDVLERYAQCASYGGLDKCIDGYARKKIMPGSGPGTK